MRLLEQHNPDLSFDWGRLLRPGSSATSGSSGSSGSPGSGSPGSREDRRRERRERREQGRQPFGARPSAALPAGAAAGDRAAAEEEEAAEATESRESVELGSIIQPAPRSTYVEPLEPVEPRTANPENPEPGEPEKPGEPGEPVPSVPSVPPVRLEEPAPVPERYARLGREGLQRLRVRYADVAARLAAKPLEEPERAELSARVERLNPDGWLTVEDVAVALEDYESVFESLRAVVGRQPRSRRL